MSFASTRRSPEGPSRATHACLTKQYFSVSQLNPFVLCEGRSALLIVALQSLIKAVHPGTFYTYFHALSYLYERVIESALRRSSGTTLVSSSVAPRGAPSRRQPRRLRGNGRESEAAVASPELSRSLRCCQPPGELAQSTSRASQSPSTLGDLAGRNEDHQRRRRARRAGGHHLPSDRFAETLRASLCGALKELESDGAPPAA